MSVRRVSLLELDQHIAEETGIHVNKVNTILREFIKELHYGRMAKRPGKRLTINHLGSFAIKNNAVRVHFSPKLREGLLLGNINPHHNYVGLQSSLVETVTNLIRHEYLANVHETITPLKREVADVINVFLRSLVRELEVMDSRFSIVGIGRFTVRKRILNNNVVKGKEVVYVTFTPGAPLRKA